MRLPLDYVYVEWALCGGWAEEIPKVKRESLLAGYPLAQVASAYRTSASETDQHR